MSRNYRRSDGTGALVMSIITLIFSLILAFGVVACASNGFTDWQFLPWVNAEEQVPPADEGTELPDETPDEEVDVPDSPDVPTQEY